MAEIWENETETHTNTGNYAVQRTGVTGRKEKEHKKTIILVYLCKNTSCDCVDHNTFSNDVFNYEVKLESWGQKCMQVTLLLVSETK